MNERSAGYIAEYLSESMLFRNDHRIGQLRLFYRPLPHGGKECRLLLPVEGARTTSTVMATMSEHLGSPRELSFPEDRGNIWMCRRLGAPGTFGYSVKREPPWVISLWSTPIVSLPQGRSYQLDDPFELASNDESDADEGWRESLEQSDADMLGDEPPAVSPEVENLVTILKRVAKVGMTLKSWETLKVLPAIRPSGPGYGEAYFVFLHGFTQLYSAQHAIKKILSEVGILNTVGLINLKAENLQSESWTGDYCLVFAETVFGRIA